MPLNQTDSRTLSNAYDVFISHASEDKDVIVRPLAIIFERLSVRVWYDEFSLQLGDSLTTSIDKGLQESRYGVVFPVEWKKSHPESHSMVHHTTEAEHVTAILKSRAKRKEAEGEASKEESK